MGPDPSDLRLYRFRLRLFVAAGIALGSGRFSPVARAGSTGGSSSDSSTGDASSSDGTTEASTSSDGGSSDGGSSDGTSEGGTAADGGSSSSGVTSVPGTEGTGGGTSTGPEDSGELPCGGCYGRPYVVEQRACVAEVSDDPTWSDAAPLEGLDRLAPEQRAALAAFWTDAGLSEHSSVAGFHRFALDLLAHGAPAELVARAQRAAVQELEHARACFGLATAYAGRAVGPGRIPLGPGAPIAASLVELAVWTVHEGCVGETVAAWLADEIHAHATDPTVRATMAKIAAEEAEHAALSWSTVRWAIAVGGATVARAVEQAFASARVDPRLPSRVECVAHGLMRSDAAVATMRRAFEEVVQPCARRLVA